MGVDSLIKLWDKGGVALVMIVLVFLLAWFIGRRGVKAFDTLAQAHTTSMTTIATAVQSSSAAQVVALGGLTERISRMEGKVDTLGAIAVREVRGNEHLHSREVKLASVVEVFDEEQGTPVAGVPIEPQSVPVQRPKPTPPKGAYQLGRATKSKP